MELSGEKLISATPAAVWRALNDPGCLSRCIPSCEYVERVSDTETNARVLMRVGPVRALFVGKILMSDIRPDEGCTMVFEGSGGGAGFAKGRSTVSLAAKDGGTLLSYTAAASVGGKLGQVGGRMIDAFAKKMADEFFGNLQHELRAAPADVTTAGLVSASPGTTAVAAVPQVAYAPKRETASSGTSESTRVLWFLLGAGATAFGFVLAHFLR
jgi:hypothetical protein